MIIQIIFIIRVVVVVIIIYKVIIVVDGWRSFRVFLLLLLSYATREGRGCFIP